MGSGPGFGVTLHPDKLMEPLRRRKPTMYFVNSMSDLFHEEIPDSFIRLVFAVMAQASQHTFQVLTKRPERAREMLSEPMRFFHGEPVWPLPNVWLGTSIENRRFVGRADVLRETPAAVRFISAEPLLGPLVPNVRVGDGDPLSRPYRMVWEDDYTGPGLELDGIDWLIVGGESGPGHRRFDPQWARDLRVACLDRLPVNDYSGERVVSTYHDTAFFMKQTGGHRPGSKLEDLPEDLRVREMP